MILNEIPQGWQMRGAVMVGYDGNQYTSVRVDDAGNLSTELTADSLVYLPIDSVSGARETIDYAHHEIHEGKSFIVSDETTSVANNATVDFLVVTGVKFPHLVMEVEGDLGLRIQAYEAVTASNNGTALTPVNRNRNSSYVSTVSVYKGPTGLGSITNLLLTHRSGTSANTGRVGGTSRETAEWVLKDNTKYLLRVTSLSGASSSLNFTLKLNWYEKSVAI